ncbi:nucleotide-diphospho-sugar transferase [Catenaria anguillulae PL171]|uniref:Nucleotide-diphospho-sugar transferase n=1 Tax=Catenaria anguillulae PL171 TaxID=765915 RepID=A0A1Y2HPE8_9FUNG|nr:nucleotide-diphospho-sugar transferase [Catenaria anguillulae PL171]
MAGIGSGGNVHEAKGVRELRTMPITSSDPNSRRTPSTETNHAKDSPAEVPNSPPLPPTTPSSPTPPPPAAPIDVLPPIAPETALPAAYAKAQSIRDAHQAKHQSPKSKWTSPIPQMIHMVWLGGSSPVGSTECKRQWIEQNKDWEFIFWDQESADYLMKTHFPSLWPMFQRLPKIVMKSDWARYAVLGVMGGIYADVDACPLKPVSQWTTVPWDKAGLVVGAEIDTDRSDYRTFANRQFQVSSWTLLSAAGHPVWASVIHESARRVREMYDPATDQWWPNVTAEICDRSGPAVVTDVVLHYMGMHGDTSFKALHGMTKVKVFGDAVLLPLTSFAPHAHGQGARGKEDPEAYIGHGFWGSWKGQ